MLFNATDLFYIIGFKLKSESPWACQILNKPLLENSKGLFFVS